MEGGCAAGAGRGPALPLPRGHPSLPQYRSPSSTLGSCSKYPSHLGFKGLKKKKKKKLRLRNLDIGSAPSRKVKLFGMLGNAPLSQRVSAQVPFHAAAQRHSLRILEALQNYSLHSGALCPNIRRKGSLLSLFYSGPSLPRKRSGGPYPVLSPLRQGVTHPRVSDPCSPELEGQREVEGET